jgi:uncharacterized membrane protein
MAAAEGLAGTPSGAGFTSRFHWSGYLLGFGLGGFFDGILLHQILQWHHLLSGLAGEAFRDIRVQILADGIFHALMYVIAAVGLWSLWRARHEFGARNADRLLFASLLVGFGVWHVVDTIFSHWITQIHRIRMDSDNPLVWDLVWLVAFGIVPLVVGIMMRRGGGRGGLVRGGTAAMAVTLTVLAGGAVASLPPPDASQVMVYFRPGTTAAQVFAAAAAVDARVIWSDQSGELWAFDLSDRSSAAGLYRHGALFVGNSLVPAGCLSWSRPF